MNRATDLRRRIEKEKLILQGALKMYYVQTDKNLRENIGREVFQLEQGIEYLEQELKSCSIEDPEGHREKSEMECDNGFKLLLHSSQKSFTYEKIHYRYNEIISMLEIESRLLSGGENMISAIAKWESKEKHTTNLISQIQASKAKVALLEIAKSRYADVYSLDPLRSKAGVDPVKVTGKLNLRIKEVSNVTNFKASSEYMVKILVDGKCLFSSHRFNDKADIIVDAAIQLEIQVFESSGTLVGLVWFPLIDLHKAILEKYGQVRTLTKNMDFSVLDLYPSGQISLKLNFIPTEQNMVTLGKAVVRREGVRKVHPKNGHRYVDQYFYKFKKCSVCGENLRQSGYICVSCDNVIHPRCCDDVYTKCLPIAEMDDSIDNNTGQFLNYNIKHRWNTVTCFLNPNWWCAHCGDKILVEKVNKCTECDVISHKKCSAMVPNFCGITKDLRNELINALDQEKKHQEMKEMKEFDVQKEMPVFVEEDYEELFKSLEGCVTVSSKTTSNLTKRLTRVKTSMTNSDTINLSQKVKLQDFRLLAVLGRGGYGKVLLASELKTEKIFAIKTLKKDVIIKKNDVNSFLLEKEILQLASIEQHPFLVNIHSCFETSTRVFFVMDYISGGDLMYHLGECRRFPQNRARFYAAEVLLALQYFHQNSIVYRDLKLENILLCPDGHIKLADYGICKKNVSFDSKTDTFCGTPEYMAPEILLAKPYGLSVDWWSLGVLIYVMLVGHFPFEGEDDREILESIKSGDLHFPHRFIPRVAVNLLLSLLSTNPAKRLGSGREDAEEIKRHPYFVGINWEALYFKECDPIFLPSLSALDDFTNFDTDYTEEDPVLTPVTSMLSNSQQSKFKDFDYISPWALESRNLVNSC